MWFTGIYTLVGVPAYWLIVGGLGRMMSLYWHRVQQQQLLEDHFNAEDYKELLDVREAR
jgi:hypothetical protein